MKRLILIGMMLWLSTAGFAQDAPKAAPVALSEIESLKIKEANGRRVGLIYQIQAIEREYKELQAKLKDTATEQAGLIQAAAKAHSVDLKTHQLSDDAKQFEPKPDEVKK